MVCTVADLLEHRSPVAAWLSELTRLWVLLLHRLVEMATDGMAMLAPQMWLKCVTSAVVLRLATLTLPLGMVLVTLQL